MLPQLQPALSEYYSDNAEPLKTRIFDSIWEAFNQPNATCVSKPKVLDLGEAQPDSFNFYSEQAGYLTIADCIKPLSELEWPEEENPNQFLTKQIEEIIPLTNIQYDLILGWDSFNFIQSKILPYVHNHLLSFCTNKTMIHGFLFTSENRPTYPSVFKILDSGRIKHAVSNDQVRQHTPLTPLAINKYMPNFKYARSVLMRSGLQEFVLTHK
ncbi:hypothetical protein MNBD_GAMMA23-1427 [hydrothermal vent metagenome]|uniref:Uncharacterized protein n=1 Tax=hydrothermal vent metagenome TaxID=652676 RepID=A0A3B0ZCT5_9ZZZZ